MNAATWFASQSFHDTRASSRGFICTASKGGGKLTCWYRTEGEADAFRKTQEGWGCTVTITEVR